ncbi:MAG: hypothetical protein ACRD51_15400 [Candidatus Acidiferrum sp.]
MKDSQLKLHVRDRTRFLLAVMEQLAGNARISFEGNLRNTRLTSMPGASEEETRILKRNTTWPKQDFVVLPLVPAMSKPLLSALGGALPNSVLHIQIEKDNVLEFGAYDNFYPESRFFGKALSKIFLDSLVSQGILRLQAKNRS